MAYITDAPKDQKEQEKTLRKEVRSCRMRSYTKLKRVPDRKNVIMDFENVDERFVSHDKDVL